VGLNCGWHTEGVFSLRRPTTTGIETQISAAAHSKAFGERLLSLKNGRTAKRLPFLFAHDLAVSTIGHGEPAFALARHQFERWSMFDLGWTRVANPEAQITPGQLVAVEAKTLGLWTLNVSRILETIEEPNRFGFLYATTALHVEEGEERFLLEFNSQTDAMTYTIEAVSRPKSPLARLGLPIARRFQRRFRRDSLRLMREAI
jgi:uncharacterized protein (UPF0548 family)